MGQYYKPINTDKKEWLYSHSYKSRFKRDDGKIIFFGVGLKLMEHSYVGNKLTEAVKGLLVEGGSWYKNHIVWAGDYADDEPESEWRNKEAEYPDKNLYAIIGTDENEIHPKSKKLPKEYRYLCNWDTKTFVDYTKLKEDGDGFIVEPLSILTCEGNGRGRRRLSQ